MPRNFFITGIPKAGKTTLLRRLINEMKGQGLRVGGIITPEEKSHGTRSGFEVMDIATGKLGILAEVNGDGPKISKYHVNIRSFEEICITALKDHKKRFDVVVIDEIGRMELRSDKFQECLDEIIDSHVPLIASLHNDFVGVYGFNGDVYVLSENNREAVYNELINQIKNEYGRMSKQPAKNKAKRGVKVKMIKKQTVKKMAKKTSIKNKQMRKQKRNVAKTRSAKKPAKTKIVKKGSTEKKKGLAHHVKHHVKKWFGI